MRWSPNGLLASLLPPCRPDELLDVGGDVSRLVLRRVPPPRPAPAVQQELLEVPPDVRPPDRPPSDVPRVVGQDVRSVRRGRERVLEPAEEAVLALPVHVDPVEHGAEGREAAARAHAGQGAEDLRLARGVLLEAELVAREAHDGQQPAREPLAQLVELRVVAARAVSQGGGVHYQDDLSHQVAEAELPPVQKCRAHAVEGRVWHFCPRHGQLYLVVPTLRD